MIYKKSANFPYPLLTNNSESYVNCEFSLDIDLTENSSDYRFWIKYIINSDFINSLLTSGQAQLVLVIQSKDNKFYYLNLNDTYIDVPKTRISLNKKTEIQLSIIAENDICFKENNNLNEFYSNFKAEIVVGKKSILGFSNVVVFEGSQRKPFDLFEKKIDPNLKSNIRIDIGYETIVICYKDEKLQFVDSNLCNVLNNPYVYMGLQKGLYKFIDSFKGDNDSVDLYDIDITESQPLFRKLYDLMKNKSIDDLSYDNVDEVIELISDGILNKYNNALRGLISG